VRTEKIKVFGGASRLLIGVSTPTVELGEDGLTAVTRFRKRYVIEGPSVRRRGEVLQELRWNRTAAGWVIVGERDARVLASAHIPACSGCTEIRSRNASPLRHPAPCKLRPPHMGACDMEPLNVMAESTMHSYST
jgi:hypothetical protein